MAFKQISAADNSTVTMSIDGVGGLVLKSNGATQVGTPQINAANPCFSAYQTAASTSITSGVWATVVNYTEEFDVTNAFNPTTGVFAPLVAGYYQVNAQVECGAASGLTRVSASIWRDTASTVIKVNSSMAYSGTNGSSLCSAPIYLDGTGAGPTGVLYMRVLATGTTPIVNGSVSYSTSFSAALISRTA